MINLSKYSKNKPKAEKKVVTSVNITEEQSDWLEKRDLNLSELVRDFLTEIMKGSKNAETK